jgi:uncharacterized protein YjeT (DUF2065 family)
MTVEALLVALALVLVIEGLAPLLGPAQWRQFFERVLALSDGQIRFIGLGSVLAGCFLLLFVT